MSDGRRGTPFLVAAPSGTGKTTLCRAVMERDSGLRFSVSHTTRAPRAGERDGIDYSFVDAAEFRELCAVANLAGLAVLGPVPQGVTVKPHYVDGSRRYS